MKLYFTISSEIVALRENFVDRPESYDSFSAKVVYFLRSDWGIFLHSHTQSDLIKVRYQKIPKTFTDYNHTITILTKIDFPLQRDQTSRSRIWQMISENSSVVLSRLLLTMPDICKVSDSTKVAGKCLKEFFDTLLWVRLCMGMEKYTPIRAHFFMRKKYTTFSTERIVALPSVNKIFPESYDFAANFTVYTNGNAFIIAYTAA
jgi:hypothetical protein